MRSEENDGVARGHSVMTREAVLHIDGDICVVVSETTTQAVKVLQVREGDTLGFAMPISATLRLSSGLARSTLICPASPKLLSQCIEPRPPNPDLPGTTEITTFARHAVSKSRAGSFFKIELSTMATEAKTVVLVTGGKLHNSGLVTC